MQKNKSMISRMMQITKGGHWMRWYYGPFSQERRSDQSLYHHGSHYKRKRDQRLADDLPF